MLERGSCEAMVSTGQTVQKGEEIGMFHYGGSTHCIVFGSSAWINQENTTPDYKVGEALGSVN